MTVKRNTMNARRVQDFLGCSRSYVYRLFETGRIDGFRLGDSRGVRFYTDSVHKFLQERMESDC